MSIRKELSKEYSEACDRAIDNQHDEALQVQADLAYARLRAYDARQEESETQGRTMMQIERNMHFHRVVFYFLVGALAMGCAWHYVGQALEQIAVK